MAAEITISLGKPVDLSPEERRQRARRARELLDGAGWAFNEHISLQTRALLDSAPEETPQRERIYASIRAATDLMGHLMQLVAIQETQDTLDDRRDRADQ